jgi:DNA-binding YbaB/EbfC family protein
VRNINDLMRKAQELKKKMEEIEAELESLRVIGEAGGGAVKATVSGKLEVVSIEISEDVIDKDDKSMLEDLIVAAIREAQNKAKQVAEEKFAEIGGLGGIPGLGFPN